jgi:hypothetical protein
LESAIVEALRERDLSLAFWLVRSIEAQGEIAPLLPAAVAAALFAEHATASYEPFGIAYEEQALDIRTAELGRGGGLLLACAGALRATIALPYGNAPQILTELATRVDGGLGDLVALVAERAPRGDLAQPGIAAADAQAAASREAAIAALSGTARVYGPSVQGDSQVRTGCGCVASIDREEGSAWSTARVDRTRRAQCD